MRLIASITALLFLSGCSVKGFPQLDDGFHTPGQLRSAAAIAKAQGQALEEIANQQQGMMQTALSAAEGLAGAVGLRRSSRAFWGPLAASWSRRLPNGSESPKRSVRARSRGWLARPDSIQVRRTHRGPTRVIRKQQPRR